MHIVHACVFGLAAGCLVLFAGWWISRSMRPAPPSAPEAKPEKKKRRAFYYDELTDMPDSIKRLSRFTFVGSGIYGWKILAGDTLLMTDNNRWCAGVSYETKEMVQDDMRTLGDAHREWKRQQISDAVDIATREWLTGANDD